MAFLFLVLSKPFIFYFVFKTNSCKESTICYLFFSINETMKQFFLLGLLAITAAALMSYHSQQPKPVYLSKACLQSCAAYETAELVALDGKNKAFVGLHENPIPFQLDSLLGNNINFNTPDGQKGSGYYIKPKQKTNKWLIVIQEWWGLNNYIKREAQKLSADLPNYHVLAIDMYDGKVATTRDSAAKYMSSTSKDRLEAIVKGAIEHAGKKAQIYSIGWCFGGAWSLQTAILAGKQAAGCVMYYGRPEMDVAKLQTISCDVLGFFGRQDRGISVDMVNKFEENMKQQGKSININFYDAGHGFANPSNPSFNVEATNDAYAKALAYLRAK